MPRLEFCTDEHVPRAYLTALESNGFSVVAGVDEPLLEWATSSERVLVTNDRDFVELDAKHDHAGLVVYTDQALTPGEFARAIRRVDRQFTPDSIRNELVWLNSWI